MIKINDKYYINANSHCFTLQERVVVKNTESANYGKEVYNDLGYYTTIDSCLKAVLKYETRSYVSQKTINSIQELLDKLDELNMKLELNRNV